MSSLPPGPPLPRALQTAVWFRRAQWVLGQCARRYGEVFSLRIAYEGTWVVLWNPDHVRQVFTGDPAVLHAGDGNRILLPILGEHSLLLLDEAPHMQQRKLLLPPFHGERMRSYGELMASVAREEIARWPRSERIATRPRMQAITLEIILRAVFGVTDASRLAPLRAELRRLLDRLTNPLWATPLLFAGPERLHRFGPFQRVMQAVDRLIYDEIAQRRSVGDLSQRADILSMLLQTEMSDRELRDELLTLLVAGHETTATALAWAVERLARHPGAMERLTAEIESGHDEYLKAVVYETLRLRPVISIVVRTLMAPFSVGGYDLPAGVRVVPSIYLVHRRPDVYPEPERFLPERFLERPPGTYTWIPFGGGVRRCLGGSFAQFEMEVVLRELVRRAVLAPGGSGDERALRRPILAPGRSGDERVLRRAITETPRHDGEVVLR